MQNTAKPFVAHAAERTQEEQMLMAAHAHQQRSTSPIITPPLEDYVSLCKWHTSERLLC